MEQYVVVIVPPEPISEFLQARFSFDLTEPHITVKAQPGLDGDLKHRWLPAIQEALSTFGSLTVQLGAVAAFGSSVIYLEVTGGRLTELHCLLMSVVAPKPRDADAYFESDNWTPHLTLEQGADVDVDRSSRLIDSRPLEPFEVSSVWLFKQGEAGDRYVRDSEISL